MTWQLAVTAVIVLIAAAYVLRAIVRPILGRGKSGCGTGCGKCAAPEVDSPPGRIQLPQIPSGR